MTHFSLVKDLPSAAAIESEVVSVVAETISLLAAVINWLPAVINWLADMISELPAVINGFAGGDQWRWQSVIKSLATGGQAAGGSYCRARRSR